MSAKVTAWVWHESQAKGTDFLVMLAHADEASDTGRVSASVRNLARKARCDERTLQRARERLVALGELNGPHATDKGPLGSAVYRVTMTAQPVILDETPDATVHQLGGGSVPPGGGTPPPADDHPRQSATPQTNTNPDTLGGGRAPGVAERRTSTTKNKEQKKKDSPSDGDGERPPTSTNDPRFVEFWAACPRRIGKAAALRKYQVAIRRGVSSQTLLDGMRRYAVACRGKDPQYIAHPETWLNQGRWDDELGATGTGGNNDAPPGYLL